MRDKLELIDGAQLRADRKARQWSQENLIDELERKSGQRKSVATLRRAENSGYATDESLSSFARALGFPPSRYRPGRELAPPSSLDLTGKWTVLYAEKD